MSLIWLFKLKLSNIEHGYALNSHYVKGKLRNFKSFDVGPSKVPYNPSLLLKNNFDYKFSQHDYAKIMSTKFL